MHSKETITWQYLCQLNPVSAMTNFLSRPNLPYTSLSCGYTNLHIIITDLLGWCLRTWIICENKTYCMNFILFSVPPKWEKEKSLETCITRRIKKKDRTFALKTLFYNILSTVPFKLFPSTGDTPFPTFLPLLECYLERTFCDGAFSWMSSWSKKDRTF